MNWKKIVSKEVPIFKTILFSDGKEVFCGFLETIDPEEDLSFFDYNERDWPVEITHWMPLPKPPREEASQVASSKQDDSR